MNTRRFIHQQVMQLKWQFWACLALVMALPLEEAVVNFKEGTGFHSAGLGSFGNTQSPSARPGSLDSCPALGIILTRPRLDNAWGLPWPMFLQALLGWVWVTQPGRALLCLL